MWTGIVGGAGFCGPLEVYETVAGWVGIEELGEQIGLFGLSGELVSLLLRGRRRLR